MRRDVALKKRRHFPSAPSVVLAQEPRGFLCESEVRQIEENFANLIVNWRGNLCRFSCPWVERRRRGAVCDSRVTRFFHGRHAGAASRSR